MSNTSNTYERDTYREHGREVTRFIITTGCEKKPIADLIREVQQPGYYSDPDDGLVARMVGHYQALQSQGVTHVFDGHTVHYPARLTIRLIHSDGDMYSATVEFPDNLDRLDASIALWRELQRRLLRALGLPKGAQLSYRITPAVLEGVLTKWRCERVYAVRTPGSFSLVSPMPRMLDCWTLV